MTIAQVSQKYGVSADTLRYYERIGLLPPVGRTKSGIRDYTEEDCNWVNFIKCMRSAGLPVETLIEYVGLFGQGDEYHSRAQRAADGTAPPTGCAHRRDAGRIGQAGQKDRRLREPTAESGAQPETVKQ